MQGQAGVEAGTTALALRPSFTHDSDEETLRPGENEDVSKQTAGEGKHSTPSSSAAERQSLTSEKYQHDPISREPTMANGSQASDTREALQHQYLEFDTPLSEITRAHSLDASSMPDLVQYTSPLDWSPARKTFTAWLSCMITLFTAYSPGSYSPPTQQMEDLWHVSHVAILLGITTYTAGFAIAPLFLAPFSELNGRRPVFIATGLLFLVCQACSAVTQTYSGMLLARLFGGVGASTFSTMVGGVLTDIYKKEGESPISLTSARDVCGQDFILPSYVLRIADQRPA